jgi:hypothetical protein
MELDELKNIWQRTQQEAIHSQNIDNEGFMLIIQKKSKAISDKLRRNLDIDMAVSSLFIPPLLYVIIWSDFAIYHKFVAVFFLIYTFIGLIYYFKVVKLYKEIDLKNDLLTTLKFTVKQFGKQVKTLTLYNQITVFPVMFYGTVVGNQLISWLTNGHTVSLLGMIISAIIITPIGYYYMKYIINVFYGKHLENLKKHLAELEVDEE